jgi:hypothetical protein
MMTSDVLPTTKDLQKKLALAEAEKAAETARRAAAEEVEKKKLLTPDVWRSPQAR